MNDYDFKEVPHFAVFFHQPPQTVSMQAPGGTGRERKLRRLRLLRAMIDSISSHALTDDTVGTAQLEATDSA